MKQIPLTQNKFALVDDADYDWLNQWKWFAHKHHSGNFYAVRNYSIGNNKQTTIKMHRQILGLEKGDKRQGDHRNHFTLDNQRDNLRICTHSQNQMNQKSNRNSTSKYKGVSWDKLNKKWTAHIQINGQQKNLGYFHNEIFAAGVYDKAATREFGEYAYLNFKLTNTEILIQ